MAKGNIEYDHVIEQDPMCSILPVDRNGGAKLRSEGSTLYMALQGRKEAMMKIWILNSEI